ncbi:hypothetical protein PPL_03379 [Heterostelium album PN500]|uniref:CID domain-containing protein n=1 Tax=Heterostelium pallidum (strain ATCC 26659 / Pp 5 / PN500) TaxID=670386 RepID=D3B4Q4_HETP5|nr:hypothetical protein PPL_03379 [Heterostelium album PN500]EFA84302.1 hypothetical protein PPL_03379 [Heterostelium album PN500]|eukprot:XP_020436418.1 hypothetical protein PPL_03379 [Heterostelium album PN500]
MNQNYYQQQQQQQQQQYYNQQTLPQQPTQQQQQQQWNYNMQQNQQHHHHHHQQQYIQQPPQYNQQQYHQQQQHQQFQQQQQYHSQQQQQQQQQQYQQALQQQQQQQQQLQNQATPQPLVDDNTLIFQFNEILNGLVNSNNYIRNTKDWMIGHEGRASIIIDQIVQRIPLNSIDQNILLLYLINDVLHFCAIKVMNGYQENYIKRVYQQLPLILQFFTNANHIQRNKIISVYIWNDHAIYTQEECNMIKKQLKIVITPGVLVSHLLDYQKNTGRKKALRNRYYYHFMKIY